MFRHTRIFSMLAALLLALVFSVGSAGRASAQAQGCDTTGTTNGTATPTYGTAGTEIVIRATGFQAGEDVSFWFTLPNGIVAGTAAPVEGGVNPDGSVGPLSFEIEQQDVDRFPGRWAITFQGASSNNVSVIYFCVLTAQQATAVAQPATATSVPATATSAPATATSVPATATSVPATATTVATVAPAISPTVAVTGTVAVITATTAPALPTNTTAPVLPAETATTVPVVPTEVMTVPTVDTGGGVIPGMPTTGQSDPSMLVTLVLAALVLLSMGVLARRAKSVNR